MVSTNPIRVLLVEDDEDDYLLTKSFLQAGAGRDYCLDWAQSYEDATRLSDDLAADVILLDYHLGAKNGLSFAEHLKDRQHPAPIIMLTGNSSLDVDLEAMRTGVVDYLCKHDLTPEHLDRSIRYAIKQAENLGAVRASQQFLLDALDSLPQSIAILDENGGIIAVNEQWRSFARENEFACDHFGVGLNYLDVCERVEGRDAFDAARVADAIRRSLDGEAVEFLLEYPCHSDYEERWYSVSVSRFRTPGPPARVIVSHEDISDRVRAERQFDSLTLTMERMIESMPAAVIGLDLEARVTHWNPAAEHIFGWTDEEIVGQPNPIFPELQRDDLIAMHNRIMSGEPFAGREVERQAKDGSLIPVHVSVAPIVSPDGEPSGALGILVDLSERVRAEEEVRRREQQYRALVENLPDTVVRYDKELRRVFSNPIADATVLASSSDLAGKHIADLGLPGDLTEQWTRRLQEVLATGNPMDVEWDAPGRNGGTFDTRVIPEIAQDGSVESVLVVSRDITERKRREEQRRFLEEASARLATTLDLDATLGSLMELLIPQFADTSSVSLFDEESVPIRRVAIAEVDGGGNVTRKGHPAWNQYSLYPTGEFGISRVYRTGEAAIHEQIATAEVLDKIAPAGLQDAMSTVDMRSAMFVPMRVRGKVIGALSFIYGPSGRSYTKEDLPFATDLANRAAIAIDNARLHRDLERSERRHRTLVEQIPAVVFTADASDMAQPTYLSPQIQQMTGYTQEELLGRDINWYDILHPDDHSRVTASDLSTIESGDSRTIEYRLITRDGRTIWVREEARLIPNAVSRQSWQGIISDVTVQKELESQLMHQAFHDTLTGLPNRALFDDRVRHALERLQRNSSKIAVCFMDLDNFKVINDSLGHGVGDELLVAVALRLQKCIRQDDTAARFGGDEFAILLEGVSTIASTVRIVSRIVAAFDEPFKIHGRELFVTPSIGISIATSDEVANRDLLREADAAMYKAKRSGKARFEIYDPVLTTDAVNRLDLENDLRKTLRGEQLTLHYQPVVDLGANEIVGVEALVRWDHPVHGMIPPGRFIPIAEETGMIVDLGSWILREACRQVQLWNGQRGHRAPLTLGVNLSARQFSDTMLVQDVRSTLQKTGLDPELLCLEITETVMTEDESAAAEMLARLKQLGIQLAVDDFGVGYSSLTSLRRFPVDVLKIDRSFVSGLVNDPNDSVIVSGVIGLAHALELMVVAEGVETVEQFDQLDELGCDLAQGFLFARPVDGVTFEREYLYRDTVITAALDAAAVEGDSDQ